MSDLTIAAFVIGGSTVVLISLFYALHRERKFERSPEGIALAEKRKREADEKQRKDEEGNRKHREWAKAHPRLASLVYCLFCGGGALVSLWLVERQWKAEWLEWFWGLVGAGYALASAWFLLAAIFTPYYAFATVFWLIGGAIALGLSAWALQSTQGTIILGFIIVIAVILYGIKEIKKVISKREN